MRIILTLIVYYTMMGGVFTMFVFILAKNPTLRLLAFEFFCWPHRVWKGFKNILNSAGRVEF